VTLKTLFNNLYDAESETTGDESIGGCSGGRGWERGVQWPGDGDDG